MSSGAEDTQKNVGLALEVCSIFLIVFSTCVVAFYLCYEITHRDRDNEMWMFSRVFLPVAFFLCIAQSVAKVFQGRNDFEDPKALKSEYAGDIVYVGAMLVLKVNYTYVYWATLKRFWLDCCLQGAIVTGMVACLICTVVQCRPTLWQLRSASCFDQEAFWMALGGFDIVSEIYSTSIFIWRIYHINWQIPGKSKLCATLCARFVPLVFAVARLPFIKPTYTAARQATALNYLGILTQLQLHLGASCLMLGRAAQLLNAAERGWHRSTSLEDLPMERRERGNIWTGSRKLHMASDGN